MALVSVIVPNYNHARFLKERLDSILGQTFQDFDLLILDDCSNDQSFSIIEEYILKFPVIKFIKNGINSGSTFIQWGKGIEQTTGKYIWIAESDDVAHPDFLETVVIKLENNSKLGLAYCQSSQINSEGEIIGSCKTWSDELDPEKFKYDFEEDGALFITNFLVHRNVIPNASAVVFRRSVFDKTVGVNTMLKTNADWLLWTSIACISDICFTSEPLNYFRRHSASVIYKHSNKITNCYKEQYDGSMRRFIDKLSISKAARKENKKYISFDKSNRALWMLEIRPFYGIWLILFAMVFPRLNFGLAKRALKKIMG